MNSQDILNDLECYFGANLIILAYNITSDFIFLDMSFLNFDYQFEFSYVRNNNQWHISSVRFYIDKELNNARYITLINTIGRLGKFLDVLTTHGCL